MRLTHLTFTGVDDSVDPTALAQLSHHQPVIEWGVLIDPHQQGQARFPSRPWRAAFERTASGARRAAHVCGRTTIELLMMSASEIDSFARDVVAIPFDRLQLNFNADAVEPVAIERWIVQWESLRATGSPWSDRRVITQHNARNRTLADRFTDVDGKPLDWHQRLFDASGGTGTSPREWPTAMPGMSCGYAGGLSDLNVSTELARIESAAGSASVWLDMETGVRTAGRFDLARVRGVIAACQSGSWS
ncbi:hypothetical protein BH10PSE17_BH10PSE17_21970 [soil metagenome]